MKWPWTRNRDEEAKLKDARLHLQRVVDQWPAVHHEAERLRTHRELNHFAESITHIFRGGR